MIVLAVILFVVGLAGAMAFALQGAPFVVTDDETATRMLTLLKPYRPQHLLDMGSGDGKLVIYLAQHGYQVDGVELNPLLVWRSRRAIRQAGLQASAAIYWASFWRYDISGYDAVVLYGVTHIMPRLEQKLCRQLPPGAHIISNYFELPSLKPVKQLSRVRAYEV